MAKLENYTGSIDLISGLRQKNGGTFPLMDANAVQTREDGTRLDVELDEIKQSIEDKKGSVIVEVGYDAETDVATADKSASEIYALVQGGASVVAVVNGENRYPYKRATLNIDGEATLVEFSFTEVGRQNDNVATYGINIDNFKDGTIWFNEYVCAGGDTSELEAKIEILEQQMADILYTEISVTSFGHNAGTKEYGETVTSVNLSWGINKTPAALTLDGEALDVSERSKALTGLSITKDNGKTWKLIATDERGAKSEKTTSITFYNGVYYGVASAPESYDSAFILGLSKELRSNKRPSFTANAGEGEYLFYCLPERMGECAFTVGGFTGGFALVDTIEFTNASGYAENYRIYKSNNANLGETSVTVA